MFVEQTKGGLLAARMKEVELRLREVTGFKIKVTETGGSKLQHLLPNTNPWAGGMCQRKECVTCGQEGEKKVDCFKRNLIYESSCTKYNPVEKDNKEAKKLEDTRDTPSIYVGESSRSIFEWSGSAETACLDRWGRLSG
jgi:hypothetical protein